MTTLQRFDPFRELHQLRRLRHGPSPFFGPVAIRGVNPESADAPAANTANATAWSIPMDVRRDDRQLTVSAALPGFAAAEVEVSISPDRVLAVKASRQTETSVDAGPETGPETGAATAEYLLRERRAGRFARAIRLPGGLDLDAAAVNLEHGVLTVTVPVAAAAQTRKLAIGGGNGNPDADAVGVAADNTDVADAGIDAAAAVSVC